NESRMLRAPTARDVPAASAPAPDRVAIQLRTGDRCGRLKAGNGLVRGDNILTTSIRFSARARVRTGLVSVALGLAILPLSGPGSAGELTLQVADPALKSDGTMSAAARQMLRYGPLPADAAALANAKAAADRAYEEAVRSGRLAPSGV